MKQNTISILKSMLLRGDEVYAVKALMNIFMGLVHGWPKLRHRGHDFAGYGLMPHKHNAGKRHHILIDKHRAESLRRRSVAGGETWGAGPARLA
ncbi:TPA: hypothetical protein N0J59_003076 [Salmonella enterica subsp. enterica serovar Weltevreden]|nr:hypothetical protein [Salmonella enterica subsp. enterica serovar Weltevreden]HCK5525825.1 hypothetical protein [Salmonella enterica subsp. enterica serovar Weltevreden]